MSTASIAWPAPSAEKMHAARSAARARRTMFDVMRLAAAYAIVWLHTPRSAVLQNSTAIGRFAVPFFVCATIFFIWRGLLDNPRREFYPYARSRFTRIYLPFLAWSMVYLAFKAVKGIALPDQPNDFPGIEFLWTGSFYHLWFMPFILVVSLVVFLLGRSLAPHRATESAAGVLFVLAGGVLASAPVPSWLSERGGLILVWNALPAVFWGMALSIAYHRGMARMLQSPAAGAVGLIVAGVCTAWIWYFGRANLPENLAGAACTIVALAPWNARWLGWLAQFGPLAYGIYLSHLLFIKSAEAVFTKLGGGNSALADLAVFTVAVVGSTALAWCLSQSRATRWLAA